MLSIRVFELVEVVEVVEVVEAVEGFGVINGFWMPFGRGL